MADRPLKILNVTAQKPDSTGSGVYLSELVRAQAESGHAPAVVCGVGPDDAVALPEGTAARPVRFETADLPFAVVGMSDEMPYRSTRYRDLTPAMVGQFERAFEGALDEMAAAFEPDIVVCHHLYLVAALARERLPRVPMGVVCHSTDLRQMAKHSLERERIVDAMRRMDAVFALHDAQAREICDVYGVDPARVEVVGTGFNQDVFNLAGSRPEGAGSKRRAGRIAYAGKIWEKKGVACLLRALSQMDASAGTPSLDLAGGHSDPAEYARIRALAQESPCAVRFLGKLPQQELAQVYRSADVFVLPSFFEGLPLVVVEALACGCKVVATDLPGIRPWLERNAPQAPVTWVAPPRMRDTDTPLAEDLPAFERALAAALSAALGAPWHPCDTGRLSWQSVNGRIVDTLSEAATRRAGV